MSDKLAGYEKYFKVPKEGICKVYDITQRKDGIWVVGYKLTKSYKGKKAGLKHIFTRRDNKAAVALQNYLYSSMALSERRKKEFELELEERCKKVKLKEKKAIKAFKEKAKLKLEELIKALKESEDKVMMNIQIDEWKQEKRLAAFTKMRQSAIKYLKENDTVELQKKHSKK